MTLSGLHFTDGETEDREVVWPSPDLVVIWKPGPVLLFRLWQKLKKTFVFKQISELPSAEFLVSGMTLADFLH